MPSRPDFEHDPENVIIDFAMYPTCNETMAVFIDDHMDVFYLEVQTTGEHNPFVELYNATGYPIVPSNLDVSDPRRLIFTYDRQPAGIYQAIVSSDVPDNGCYFQVSGVTEMNIYLGFIQYTGNNRDPERSDFPFRNVYLDSLNLITAHPHNLPSPGSIAAISIFQEYNILTRPERMNLRYGCSYEYFVNAMHCSKTGKYYAKIDGYDFFGNSFRRVANFDCEVNPNPTVTTTTTAPPPVTACQNNGEFVSNGNASYCYCGPLFTGSDCSQVICLNGGTSFGGNTCMCQSGFTGDMCQDVRCTDDSGFNFPKDFPVPTFVIRVRSQMSSIIKQINTQISALALQFQNDPLAFQNFGLVTFNNNGSTFDGQYFTSVEDLQTALLNLANTQDSTGDCMDTTFEAINYAFNRFIIGQRSPIYVFSDAIPSDPDYISNVIEFNSFILSPIYIFQLEPTDVTCQSTDLFTPAWQALQSVTAKSSGNLFFVGSKEYSGVGSLFYTHMYNTYYRGDLMLSDDADECVNQQEYSTVSIDSGFETLTIVASGSQLDLILTSPEGALITPNVSVQLNYTSIWTISGLEAGQWQINMVSGDPHFRCSIRAYASIPPARGGASPQRTLYWGFTTDLTYDSPLRQPLLGLENSMVIHIDGARMAERKRISAEVAIYERTQTGKILSYAANGLWRSECSFELFFPKYQCRHANDMLYFTVFFRDDNDFMVQRAGAMYCAEFRPTQVPPGTCQNGGFSYNFTCICPSQYTGSVCETPVCWNGGTPNRDHCTCIPGYEGTFCEISKCLVTNPGPEFGRYHKSMTFLLDVSYNNYPVLQQLQKYMTEMLRDISLTGRNWIDEFNVMGYDEKQIYYIATTRRENISVIADGFATALNISLTNYNDCNAVDVWEALDAAAHLTSNFGLIFNFQTSPPMETLKEPISRAGDNIANKQILFNSFISSTSQGVYACNNNAATFANIKTVCEGTEGDSFDITSSNFANILRIIPTFYKTNVVYKKTYSDCTNGCYLYYPIDAHSQNSQIMINGAPGKIQQQIFMPNLTQLTTVPSLLTDTSTGWEIIEIRRACPQGWSDLGKQYCFILNTTPMSWVDAQAYCQNNDGFLIDDVSPDKNQFLTTVDGVNAFWLGLNDRTTVGTYFWDRGSLEPHQLGAHDYTNWGSNVNLNDTTKRCVYMSGTWAVDDCTVKRQFMCQSHKFSDSFDPNPSEERALPPGKWSAVITNPGKTIVQIKVQSELQLLTGYTVNQHDDFPLANPQAGTTANMMLAHIPNMATITRDTLLVNTQIYDFYNNTMYAAANYELRADCVFQFQSEPFICPNSQSVKNAFSSLSTGFDEYGFTFQRMRVAHCAEELATCGNGGVVYNGMCVCGEYWTGAQCEQPICVNNGTLSNDSRFCTCPVGYEGIACEREVCTTNSPDNTDQYNKTFALVVESTSLNTNAIKQIQQNLQATLNSVKAGWFTQYVLVVVDSNNTPYLKISNNVNDFQTNLLQITPADSTTSCGIPLYNAMSTALHQINVANSVLYVVARSIPSDLSLEVSFVQLVAQKQPQFYYHSITGDSGCTTNFDDPATNRLQHYTIASGATLKTVKAGWFSQYVLVVVDSYNKPYLKISTNVNDFQTNLLQITPADSTTSCGIPLYNAMSTALHQINVASSILYVVARSIPTDLNLEVSFAQLVAQKQPQFYYHSITGDSGCTTNFNDPATSRLQQYAIASSGNFIATTGATVGSFMNVYIPPMFTGGVLRNPTVSTGTCNSTDVHYLLIDSDTTDIFISIYSNYPSASVISPSGQIEVLKTLYSDSNVTSGPKLSIFTVSSIAEFGMYSLTLHGSGACYAQVKSTGGAELYLGYVPSPSATSNIGSHLDNSTSVPLNDYNMFVGKVVDDFARITYAEILDGYTGEFQYVKFYRRGNCTHNYYSDPFKCGQGLLIIKYFGIDVSGQMFVRDGFTLCLNAGIPTISTTPIPSGQTTTTLPSGQTVTIPSGQTTTTVQQSGVTTTTASSSSLKTDAANIYLVLDTSSAVPGTSYSSIFSNFVAQILAQYNVSPQYINVALSGSPGDSNLWLTNPTFNTFTSLSMLKNSINGSYYPIDGPQSSGQSQLSSVLGQATNSNFLATGYNSGNIPHLIIYLTTTSIPDNNAISTGQTIINGKQFQIISIAFGSSLSNTNALQSMSSCVYTASSVNDLNNLASTLTTKLSSSYTNNGIYAC
uniref:EGF-like domain-containing protein n=1 Tax=Parastrongyloides trichosuri TaxID=131310 RepID=A0A0N5A152_PARTI